MSDHQIERRAHVLTEEKVSLMIEEAVEDALTKHEEQMRTFIKGEFGQLHSLISAAFPNGDVHGHKIAHEKAIRDANRWDQIKADFIGTAFKTGLMAAIGFMLVAAWESIKNEVKK